ncbi:MAG: 1-acyl-sn-glycerol-3-phosphate acyltransferase [Bacteroidetes bacterium]|nr:1-acyl-sn-glycerol-3-phosphate acyltransferase [Bacteroidota bacterium]
MLKRILQPFYTFYVITTFAACLLAAFPVFLMVGSFDKAWARRIIWNIAHYWSYCWLFCIGQPVIRKGKRPDNKKYVYVANHISYMDTVLIYAAVPYYFRTLAKKEMAKIPVFGFVYKQLAILVDRSSEHSRAKSLRLMWRMLKRECNIAVFPEGTFNETGKPLKEFYDGAFRLAINTQTPVLPMIFPDTVNRWHYSAWWKLTPGRNRVIYLEPVETKGLVASDLPVLKQKVYSVMEAALQKF